MYVTENGGEFRNKVRNTGKSQEMHFNYVFGTNLLSCEPFLFLTPKTNRSIVQPQHKSEDEKSPNKETELVLVEVVVCLPQAT